MSHEANRDFILAALHAIATAPTLEQLRGSLVLKGGVALLLAYDSPRASRADMDFGLTHRDHRPTQEDSDNLLAELADWSAEPRGSRDIEVKGESVDTPLIRFVHPVTLEEGFLKLQASGIQVPPVLGAELPAEAFRTHDGRKFRFPVLRVSEIAAEKMCRLWRPDKRPPRVVDLYDIGFCGEQRGFDIDQVGKVVRRHRKADSEGHLIRIKEMHPEVRLLASNPPTDVARRLAFFGPSATDEDIRRLVQAGWTLLETVRLALEA